MSSITLLTNGQIPSMDRTHNTRRRTAQRAAEVATNPAPEPMGQMRQETTPRPLKRGRGRGENGVGSGKTWRV